MTQKRDESRKTAQSDIYNLSHQKREQVHFGASEEQGCVLVWWRHKVTDCLAFNGENLASDVGGSPGLLWNHFKQTCPLK